MTYGQAKDKKLQVKGAMIGAYFFAVIAFSIWVFNQLESLLISADFFQKMSSNRVEALFESATIAFTLTISSYFLFKSIKEKSKLVFIMLPLTLAILAGCGYTILSEKSSIKLQGKFSMQSDLEYQQLLKDDTRKAKSLETAEAQLLILNKVTDEINRNHRLESFNCEVEKKGGAINKCKTAEDIAKEKKLARNDKAISDQNTLIKTRTKNSEEASDSLKARIAELKDSKKKLTNNSFVSPYALFMAYKYDVLASLFFSVFLFFLSTANSLKNKHAQCAEQVSSMSEADEQQYTTAKKQLTSSDYLRELNAEIFDRELFSTSKRKVYTKYQGSLTRTEIDKAFEQGKKIGVFYSWYDKAGREHFDWTKKETEYPTLRSVVNG